MADPYPIRPIAADEYPFFRRVHDHAFNSGPASPVRWARALRQFEPERSLAAIDDTLPAGETMVGTTGAYSLRMTVPGAALPVAGVSAVSVLPSHRRRGVLRSLMHRQLADLAGRGEEPIAVLWASETPIYARYGYGRASSNAYFRFERGDGAMAATAPADPAQRRQLPGPHPEPPARGHLAQIPPERQGGPDLWKRGLYRAHRPILQGRRDEAARVAERGHRQRDDVGLVPGLLQVQVAGQAVAGN